MSTDDTGKAQSQGTSRHGIDQVPMEHFINNMGSVKFHESNQQISGKKKRGNNQRCWSNLNDIYIILIEKFFKKSPVTLSYLLVQASPCFPREIILTICAISILGSDKKYKYIFMFLRESQHVKG